GQRESTVDTILLYGEDNPIDGAVLKVLIRKAIDIREMLGITVPVPVNSESVLEAVLRSLFLGSSTIDQPVQLSMFDELPFDNLDEVHRAWEASAKREQES